MPLECRLVTTTEGRRHRELGDRAIGTGRDPPDVRLRTNKRAGSRSAGLAMAYKLLDAAHTLWRCVNAPHLVALVRAGATFVDGLIIERED
jgi:hypothetical protein